MKAFDTPVISIVLIQFHRACFYPRWLFHLCTICHCLFALQTNPCHSVQRLSEPFSKWMQSSSKQALCQPWPVFEITKTASGDDHSDLDCLQFLEKKVLCWVCVCVESAFICVAVPVPPEELSVLLKAMSVLLHCYLITAQHYYFDSCLEKKTNMLC